MGKFHRTDGYVLMVMRERIYQYLIVVIPFCVPLFK